MPVLPSVKLTLWKCLSREKFCSIRLCVSQRFKKISFYFLLVLLVSSDVPHSCAWSRNHSSVLNWFPNLASFSLASNLHLYVPRLAFHRIEKWIDCIFNRANHYFLLWFDLSGLAMCQSRHFGIGIRNYPKWISERCQFWPSIKSVHM